MKITTALIRTLKSRPLRKLLKFNKAERLNHRSNKFARGFAKNIASTKEITEDVKPMMFRKKPFRHPKYPNKRKNIQMHISSHMINYIPERGACQIEKKKKCSTWNIFNCYRSKPFLIVSRILLSSDFVWYSIVSLPWDSEP